LRHELLHIFRQPFFSQVEVIGMISRRKVLKGGAIGAVMVAVPFIRIPRAVGQTATTFDYYISPNGDDNNNGSLGSPWSITALNSKQSTYAGKRVGIIGDKGVIQVGRVGGVTTTLYSIYQTKPYSSSAVLAVNGGTSSTQPTYIASCNSSGNYTPRLAIIDCSDPSTGNLPTQEASVFGQSQYNSATPVANYGNLTVDALVIRNFTFSALVFYGSAGTPINNLTIQNCEIYNGQNVQSNNNPGAIYVDFGNNATITNCKIHDLKSNAAGTSYTMQLMGYIQFNSYGTKISNCTFYNCAAVSNKDGWQQMDVSYCYLGYGAFGSPYAGGAGTTSIGGTVHNLLTGAGKTIHFHHNIVLGPVLGWGESSQENQGSVLIYNNTFFEPVVGGANGKLCALYNIKGNAGGTWSFYNNLVYSLDGYENGNNAAAALAMYNASTTPSIFATCDHNAYGSGMTFGSSYASGQYNLPLSKWQSFGFDAHSVTLTGTPFVGTAAEGNASSFAISGPATTAGVGGVACGAVDDSGLVGCDFAGGGAVPMAPALSVS
jgi:hypothetical protein